MSKTKRNSLLFLIAAGILTLLLAMSLPTLILSPGESFSLDKTDVKLPGVEDTSSGSQVNLLILRGLIALSLILLPIYILHSLFTPAGRRNLVRNLLVMLALFWFTNYLSKYQFDMGVAEPTIKLEAPSNGVGEDTSSHVFSEDSAPAWLAMTVIFIGSILSVGLLVVGIKTFQWHARKQPELHPLAKTAQEAIDTLQAGGDLKAVIIRCYYEMNRVVKEEQGIARETAMTPREFETYLVSRGLPQAALETLTRLFEQVRYGAGLSKTNDEAVAFACLTEIVNICKAAKNGQVRP